MVAIAGFSSTALRPLLPRVLFPQVTAQGAYPRAGGAGPECQHLGLILASISSPPCTRRGFRGDLWRVARLLPRRGQGHAARQGDLRTAILAARGAAAAAGIAHECQARWDVR